MSHEWNYSGLLRFLSGSDMGDEGVEVMCEALKERKAGESWGMCCLGLNFMDYRRLPRCSEGKVLGGKVRGSRRFVGC